MGNSSEGDCRYIAPETLQNIFTKAADIFSLGITILELASKLELPKNGYLWHTLRSGILPDHFLPRTIFSFISTRIFYLIRIIHILIIFYRLQIDLSTDLQNVIKSMMHPNWELRPNVDALLAVPQIKKIIQRRLWMKPFVRVVSVHYYSNGKIDSLLISRIIIIAEEIFAKFNGPIACTKDLHNEFLCIAVLLLQTKAPQKTEPYTQHCYDINTNRTYINHSTNVR